jgi:hypothetical protein
MPASIIPAFLNSMRIRIITFFLITSVPAFAQYSKGYMGRRMILTINGMYFPASEATGRKADGFRLNTTHTAGIEFVAGNETSLCASAGFFKTGLTYDKRVYTRYSEGGIYYTGHSDIPVTISVKQFSIAIKKFRHRAIAPIGFNLKWELFYQTGTVDFNKDHFFWEKRDYFGTIRLVNPSSGSISYKAIGFGFSIGFQRILFDRMVLDYGARLALCAGDDGPYSDPVVGNIMPKAYARVLGQQLFNVRIGLGFLAF